MKKPEYHSFDEFQIRSKKLEEIRELGIDPYPAVFTPDTTANKLHNEFDEKDIGDSTSAEEGATEEVTIAGRLVLFRAMGKNAFAQIQDSTGRLQLMFNRDNTIVEGLVSDEIRHIKFIEKKLDLGDIIGVTGHLFKTQKGELTLYVKSCTLLTKTLLPLPDKHSGLTDKGTRYKKRWLDLIDHENVHKTFAMRSKIFSLIRRFFEDAEFMEVETPVLQNIYGGAEAAPFISHLNALKQDMYLRIALEISLKKLIVGGVSKVFEIGKVFRNEGIDRTHNPEFTMLEAYASYWDYNKMMDFTEKLFEHIAIKLFGSTEIGTRMDKDGKEHIIDVKTPWKRISMKDSIKEYASIDVESLSDEELRSKLPSDTDGLKDAPRGKLIQWIFEEHVEHKLIDPHHITDHPIETTPLCKLHRDEKERKENIVERFETFILGFEFCNAYTELNDPVLQRKLLESQADKRDAGDEEASPLDEEFIEAICQGMPPCSGIGIGLDRLTMLFTGEHSIRDVIFFPILNSGKE